MELVKGINTKIKKVGNHSLKSANFTNLNCCIIIAPVIIITGAIAASGINDSKGIKKIAAKNNKPEVIAITPLRPPLWIPEALSAAATVGLVPKNPERKAAIYLA